MKIIYMGTPDFAVEALEALASSRHEVTAVFLHSRIKPKGRGKAMQFTPVKEWHLGEYSGLSAEKGKRSGSDPKDPGTCTGCTGCCGVWTDHTTGDPGHRNRMAASTCMVHFYRNIAELLRSSGR